MTGGAEPLVRRRNRAAVLGSPIAHTLSPVLHRAAYAALGLDWSYDVIECDGPALPGLMPRLVGSSYAGLSLTMPLKRAVLPLLDTVDDAAAALGAVNTVVVGDDGLRGYNTDVSGVVVSLAELGVQVDGASVVMLGAGGAARAVLAGLAQVGGRSVTVYVRDPTRGAALVALGERLQVAVAVEPWERAAAGAQAADLLISTVPAGAADGIAAGRWSGSTAVFDLVYAPWPTRLGATALAAGAPVVGGLPMLVAQAAEAVRLMTGCEPPLAAMRAAGEKALAARA